MLESLNIPLSFSLGNLIEIEYAWLKSKLIINKLLLKQNKNIWKWIYLCLNVD